MFYPTNSLRWRGHRSASNTSYTTQCDITSTFNNNAKCLGTRNVFMCIIFCACGTYKKEERQISTEIYSLRVRSGHRRKRFRESNKSLTVLHLIRTTTTRRRNLKNGHSHSDCHSGVYCMRVGWTVQLVAFGSLLVEDSKVSASTFNFEGPD